MRKKSENDVICGWMNLFFKWIKIKKLLKLLYKDEDLYEKLCLWNLSYCIRNVNFFFKIIFLRMLNSMFIFILKVCLFEWIFLKCTKIQKVVKITWEKQKFMQKFMLEIWVNVLIATSFYSWIYFFNFFTKSNSICIAILKMLIF